MALLEACTLSPGAADARALLNALTAAAAGLTDATAEQHQQLQQQQGLDRGGSGLLSTAAPMGYPTAAPWAQSPGLTRGATAVQPPPAAAAAAVALTPAASGLGMVSPAVIPLQAPLFSPAVGGYFSPAVGGYAAAGAQAVARSALAAAAAGQGAAAFGTPVQQVSARPWVLSQPASCSSHAAGQHISCPDTLPDHPILALLMCCRARGHCLPRSRPHPVPPACLLMSRTSAACSSSSQKQMMALHPFPAVHLPSLALFLLLLLAILLLLAVLLQPRAVLLLPSVLWLPPQALRLLLAVLLLLVLAVPLLLLPSSAPQQALSRHPVSTLLSSLVSSCLVSNLLSSRVNSLLSSTLTSRCQLQSCCCLRSALRSLLWRSWQGSQAQSRGQAQVQGQGQGQAPKQSQGRRQVQAQVQGQRQGQAPKQSQGWRQAQGRGQAQVQGQWQGQAPKQSQGRRQAPGRGQAQAGGKWQVQTFRRSQGQRQMQEQGLVLHLWWLDLVPFPCHKLLPRQMPSLRHTLAALCPLTWCRGCSLTLMQSHRRSLLTPTL